MCFALLVLFFQSRNKEKLTTALFAKFDKRISRDEKEMKLKRKGAKFRRTVLDEKISNHHIYYM